MAPCGTIGYWNARMNALNANCQLSFKIGRKGIKSENRQIK